MNAVYHSNLSKDAKHLDILMFVSFAKRQKGFVSIAGSKGFDIYCLHCLISDTLFLFIAERFCCIVSDRL